jgi:hypothetical protein
MSLVRKLKRNERFLRRMKKLVRSLYKLCKKFLRISLEACSKFKSSFATLLLPLPLCAPCLLAAHSMSSRAVLLSCCSLYLYVYPVCLPLPQCVQEQFWYFATLLFSLPLCAPCLLAVPSMSSRAILLSCCSLYLYVLPVCLPLPQ